MRFFRRLLHVLVPRFLAPMNPLSPGTFGQAHCTYFRFTCSLLSCGRQIPSSDLVLAGDPWVRYLGVLVTYFCEGFCWGPIPIAQWSRPLLIVAKQLQCVYSWIQVRLWWDQWWQETMWPLRWQSILGESSQIEVRRGDLTTKGIFLYSLGFPGWRDNTLVLLQELDKIMRTLLSICSWFHPWCGVLDVSPSPPTHPCIWGDVPCFDDWCWWWTGAAGVGHAAWWSWMVLAWPVETNHLRKELTFCSGSFIESTDTGIPHVKSISPTFRTLHSLNDQDNIRTYCNICVTMRVHLSWLMFSFRWKPARDICMILCIYKCIFIQNITIHTIHCLWNVWVYVPWQLMSNHSPICCLCISHIYIYSRYMVVYTVRVLSEGYPHFPFEINAHVPARYMWPGIGIMLNSTIPIANCPQTIPNLQMFSCNSRFLYSMWKVDGAVPHVVLVFVGLLINFLLEITPSTCTLVYQCHPCPAPLAQET